MALFFFLANTLLILIVVYALRFPIILLGLILWKLRYVLLVLVGLLGFVFGRTAYMNHQMMENVRHEQAQEAQRQAAQEAHWQALRNR